MKALILAGGRGSRLNELTDDRNKSMLNLFEKPLIKYNLEHAFKAGVDEILIVVCYKKNEIIKNIGNEYKGIKISYIEIEGEKIKEGLITGIEASKKALNGEDFILMLADEILINADISGIVDKFKKEDALAVCGITFDDSQESIAKTYTAMVDEKLRAFRLIEKPKAMINKIKGTGHIVLKNEILNYIDRTPINAFRNQKELVDLIQIAIDDGKKVLCYKITEGYVNVNTKEDFEMAKKMIVESNPKVLIVHNQMKYFGGAELLIVELSNQLTKRGIKNDILALSTSKDVEKLLIDSKIIVPENNLIIQPPGYRSIKDIFTAIKIFRKELRRIGERYDLINFHDFPTTWTLYPKKKATVWFMNQPPNLWSNPDASFFLKILNKFRIILDRYIVNHSIEVITLSDEFNRSRARERYGRDSIIVYCGLRHDLFSSGNKERAIKKYNLKNKFVILQSGMLSQVKNQMESIRTLEKLKNKIPNAILILSGKDDPEYKKQIDNYIKEKKLEKDVLFIGMFDSREELSDLYKMADVGLYPIGKQGGWLAPFETLCAETPIVVSNQMGIASLVREKQLGIVSEDFNNAIWDIYKNPGKYKKQARLSSKWIKENLSWEIFAEKMIDAFKIALKKNKNKKLIS